MSREEFEKLFKSDNEVSGKPYRGPRSGADLDRVVLWVVAVAALLWSLLMVVVVVAQRAEGAPVRPSPESEQIVAPSCQVEAGQVYGSGTVIRLDDGRLYVLTCSHVVEKAAEDAWVTYTDEDGREVRLETPVVLKCTLADGRKFSATAVLWNPDYSTRGHDLALLRVDMHPEDQGRFPFAHLPEEQVEFSIGEPTWYCGWGNAVPHSLEKTIINHVDERYIRANGLGWFGHSGSGVYVRRDGKYLMVGVLVQLVGRDAERAPVLAEYRILEFLADYRRAQKGREK